jgi:hypothetical protein
MLAAGFDDVKNVVPKFSPMKGLKMILSFAGQKRSCSRGR